MGAKVEFLHGPFSNFGIEGDVTLDQLRSDWVKTALGTTLCGFG